MPSPVAAPSEATTQPTLVAPLPGSAEDTSPQFLREVVVNEEVVIRQAEPVEFEQIEDLLVKAFNTGCWVARSYERNLRTIAQRALRFHVWVAASADGVLGVVLTPRLEHYQASSFTFSVLAVHPSARGLHLGEHLIRHAFALARTHGFSSVEIHSSPQMSEAHRIYYRVGFVRHLDAETRFMDEHEERLLSFSYRLPDPLPAAEAVVVPPSTTPLPVFGPWAQPATDKSVWPAPPAGEIDGSGAYVVTGDKHDLVAQRAAELDREVKRHQAQALTDDEANLAKPRTQMSPTEPVVRSSSTEQTDTVAKLEVQIEQDLWDGIYTQLYSSSPEASEAALRLLIARLDYLDARLAHGGPFLHGDSLQSDDLLLTAWLLSYDFGFRAGVGFGAAATINFPRLWDFARRVLARLDAIDLVPTADAASPWGDLPPVPALEPLGFATLRDGWLAAVPPTGSAARIRPTGARLTPYMEDLPAVTKQTQNALLEIVATVPQATDDEPTLATRLRDDLYDAAIQLSQGADALTQLALRRVFQARLHWLDYRLSTQPWADGPHESATDYVLRPLLTQFETVADIFPPIDPILADYPSLLKYVERIS
ncbi:MAG: GNAT family N-acetyltransferase [Propionibacteriaceae bacterium]|jgi:putative glutathione S-transferase|nr:GNAT family N-acetyltransferase [Propionibacteriaceae bacterium]